MNKNIQKCIDDLVNHSLMYSENLDLTVENISKVSKHNKQSEILAKKYIEEVGSYSQIEKLPTEIMNFLYQAKIFLDGAGGNYVTNEILDNFGDSFASISDYFPKPNKCIRPKCEGQPVENYISFDSAKGTLTDIHFKAFIRCSICGIRSSNSYSLDYKIAVKEAWKSWNGDAKNETGVES